MAKWAKSTLPMAGWAAHKAITTTTSAASMTTTLTARPVARITAATPYASVAWGGRIMTVRTSP